MISLFEPGKGLSFAEVRELQEPSYFRDLNMDQYASFFKEFEVGAELIPYFYYLPKTKEESGHRQSVMKDLCDHDVRAAVNRFISGIGVAERYLGYSEIVNASVQKWKWRLDTIVQFYSAIDRFCRDLTENPPKSEPLLKLRDDFTAYLNDAETVKTRAKAEEISGEFDKMRFHITINKERATLDFQYSEEDYCSSIRSEFPRAEGEREETSFTESPFGDINIAPLEEFILNQFMKQDRVLFRNLETFCGIKRDIILPEVSDLIREFRFALLNLEHFEKLKNNGFPFSFPEIVEDREVNLDDCFDIVLAAKNLSENKEVVLNDIMKSKEETAILVTGPNQGGKTTLARAFGQCAYFGMMGFPVPAGVSRLPFVDRIFTQFASTAGNDVEGRLEHELTGVKAILDSLTDHSLVIFNELFTSAPTMDALTMSRALLSTLIEKNAVCFVVTHTFELAFDSDRFVSLVATVVEDGSFRRTYRIIRKSADGIAYANSIVSKYKLDYSHIFGRIRAR